MKKHLTKSSLLIAMTCVMGLAVGNGLSYGQSKESESSGALDRVKYDVKYLASDELEGRGVETDGIHKAADYIIEEFKKVGVKGGGKNGSYKQKFPISTGRKIDKTATELSFAGPMSKKSLNIDKDFQALVCGGAADVSGDLVFVGYSINSEDHNYNDYKNVDVKGKVVVMIRREPQVDDEKSAFDGKKDSKHARILTKLRAAKKAGAAAVIIVNDRSTSKDGKKDDVPTTAEFGTRLPPSGRLPFAFMTRKSFDEILKTAPLSLPTGGKLESLLDIENHIDQKLEPVSQPLKDWKATYKSSFPESTVDGFNIVGVIEGEGPNADETIIIGGHYDHLGKGLGNDARGSRRRGSTEVHNGADDNATGTAAVIELARRYAKYDKKPGRRLVFVAFSGEERGLLGSNYWCRDEPLYPLDKTVAMINYDMIGWYRTSDVGLKIYGSGTAKVFDKVLDDANAEFKLKLSKTPSPFAGSDHMPFNSKKIPCMFLHTGLTDTYHTPDDDYETLNMEGALKVIDYSEKLIWDLANLEDKPTYSNPGRRTRPRPRTDDSAKSKAKAKSKAAPAKSDAGYIGVKLFDTDNGIEITEVQENTAASKGGLRVGDIVLKFDGKEFKSAEPLTEAVMKKKIGEQVEVIVKRGETTIKTKFKLGKRPR